jgi:hypothetical protein
MRHHARQSVVDGVVVSGGLQAADELGYDTTFNPALAPVRVAALPGFLLHVRRRRVRQPLGGILAKFDDS